MALTNLAPTAVVLTNAVASVDENTATASRFKVADIVAVDDALGTNTLSLTGADAAFFEIDGTSLYLKAGTVLDYEAKTSYAVAVAVDDATIGSTPDATSATYTLAVGNVVDTAVEAFLVAAGGVIAGAVTPTNVAPTAVVLTQTLASIDENTATASHIKVADIVVVDDALGTNTLSLTGADAALFEIVGTSLYLKAGTTLDFETKASYAVAVTVDDPDRGGAPDAISATYSLAVADVNETPGPTPDNLPPILVGLPNAIPSIAENTDTTGRIKVADVLVINLRPGTYTAGLTGADAAFFEIDGTSLYLKAGTVLDYETKPVYLVAATADDPATSGPPDAVSATYTLVVADVAEVPNTPTASNRPPTAIDLLNAVAVMSESIPNGVTITDSPPNLPTSVDTKVADIAVIDDGAGANTLSITGPDAGFFFIAGTSLYLKAGTVLDYEQKSTYSIIVSADDTATGGSPDASVSYTLNVQNEVDNFFDVLQALVDFLRTYTVPTTVLLTNTLATIDENTPTTGRIKVADFSVIDANGRPDSIALSGPDANVFEIEGTSLYLKAGTVLDHESHASYSVAVEALLNALPDRPPAYATYTLAVADLNEAPTAVALTNTVASLDDATMTASRIKVADIVVTDDALGTNTYGLTGADAAFFEIDGTSLYLKAGTALDAGTKASYAVAVTVDDPDKGATPDATSTTHSLAVIHIDKAAVAQSGSASGDEDSPTSGVLFATDVDTPAAQLAFVLVNDAAHGAVTINPDGTYTYVPDANYNGPDSFDFNVNDGTLDSNVATQSITVNEVNDAPLALDGLAGGAEDGVVTGVLSASDVDSAALTYSRVSDATHGTVTVNPDGTFTYVPVADYYGADSFTFRANDGSLDGNIATVNLTINAVDDAPLTFDASASGSEDAVISGALLATDIDGPSLTYDLVTNAAHGTVAVNADGTFSYTPDLNFNGTDSFTFKANDGTLDSNISTVALTIAAVNDAPLAQDGSAGANSFETLSGTLTAADVEGAALTFSLVAGAGHGTVTVNPDGTFSYTASPHYGGIDTFSFKANDGSLDSNIATQTITVVAVNHAPVAQAGAAAGHEGWIKTGTLLASDRDGDPLTYALAAQAAHGTVVVNANGTFSYTPAPQFHGTDSFTFRASDGDLASSAETFTLTIAARILGDATSDPLTTPVVDTGVGSGTLGGPPGTPTGPAGSSSPLGIADIATVPAATAQIAGWSEQGVVTDPGIRDHFGVDALTPSQIHGGLGSAAAEWWV